MNFRINKLRHPFTFVGIIVSVCCQWFLGSDSKNCGWSQQVNSETLEAPEVSNVEPEADEQSLPQFQRAAVIEFKGEIDYALTRYFFNRLELARRDRVDLLIIEIDSPGGLKVESLRIAEALSKCTWARTVAFIGNEAISGGALVALGCDEIVIAADAKMGNIGEIGFDIEAMAFRLIRPKVESSLAHDARRLAEAKGRPADLVEAFVDKDILVFQKRDGQGQWEFKQARVDDPIQPEAPWELIPETKPERFMLLSGKRAKELTLVDRHATTREELAQILRIDLGKLKVYRYTSNDTMVHLLNNPFITGLLIVVGLVALFIELSSPGLGAGGLVAGLCMLLFFWSRYLGGTAGWLEILLFAAGLVFIVMELFVIPGFGVSGIMGVLLLFFSVVLAGQNYMVPSTTDEWNQTINSVLMLMVSGIVFMIAAVFITKNFGSIPILNKLILEPPPLDGSYSESNRGGKDETGKPVPANHPIVSIGDWGVAESLLRPAGRVKFAGRSVDVISDGAFIDPGKQVKVIRINGNVVTVCEVEDQTGTT